MTGIQLAIEIIRIRADTPVILCSGFSRSIDERKAALIGIRAFLMKPLATKEIAGTVRKVLDTCNT